MKSILVSQISLRMKAKNLSASALEKNAGVKPNAVNNILKGKSKKPSANMLQSVADALDCTVRDLLVDEGMFKDKDNENLEDNEKILDNPCHNPQLLGDILITIMSEMKEKKKQMSLRQIINTLQEAYIFSTQKTQSTMDKNFIGWFINLTP